MLCFQGVTLKSVMLEFSSIVYLTAPLFLILCSMIITTLFRPTCRKPLSLTVAKSHFFSRLIKATILAQAWNFSSVCLKAMLFPSPFFPTLFLYSFPQVTVFPRYSQVKFLTTLFTYSRSAPHTLYASNDYYRFFLALVLNY